ncbi:hypothetical protein CRUP_006498 [Coryphaenoides rupestris]|nr:hypothetical protein CRUP_006498 [Coryphaenoides rupestris]
MANPAPDNLLASVVAHPVLTASGLPGRDHRFVPPGTAAAAAASVLASLSASQLPPAGRGRSQHPLPSPLHPDSPLDRSDRTVIDRGLRGTGRTLCPCGSFTPTPVLLKHAAPAPLVRAPSTWGAGRRRRRRMRMREKRRSSVDLLPNNKTAGVAAEVPYVMGGIFVG